jgi:hypothetical protein
MWLEKLGGNIVRIFIKKKQRATYELYTECELISYYHMYYIHCMGRGACICKYRKNRLMYTGAL